MRISSALKSPVTFGKNRKKIDGAHLLLSSFEPDVPRKSFLGPPRQLTRYGLVETASKTDINLDALCAMRRFVQPKPSVNVAQLGALWRPYFSRRSHLPEMLDACFRSQDGVQALLRADVVAERDVITQLMLPHKASFNASFVHGVLFLEEGPKGPEFDYGARERKMGFLRVCTEMYADKWPASPGRSNRTLHSVVGRQLGGLNLLMSGSVDCVKLEYNGQPDCYMQFVTRPMYNGQYTIRPKVWKNWYLRAHLMGIPWLYLGLIDEVGILRQTRQLVTGLLPKAAGNAWDPADNIHWAFRVLTALRDYCQEAADVCEVVTPSRAHRGLWRVEIVPSVDGEIRVLVRELPERLAPSAPVIRNFEAALERVH
ncbi:hypothetical protein FB45DRAFT_69585 [Roridomyces roridus]|uniref:Decapping nuclease n=1 Tax=Roridomyces roridus TaxID=1738132 RepID=A0AAD7BN88_9AGAR|nr:hypothetical protein FB45DRAFT_69585 [Roridomyces roridus]